MSIATATFVLLVGGAAWFDVHERRVPNWLNVTLLGTGVLFGLASVSAWTDMVLGIGIAFGVILPFFALRVYRGETRSSSSLAELGSSPSNGWLVLPWGWLSVPFGRSWF